MASAGEKSLAVGHIPGFQIDPKFPRRKPRLRISETGAAVFTWNAYLALMTRSLRIYLVSPSVMGMASTVASYHSCVSVLRNSVSIW